jgi:hypothetical protein
LPVFSDGFSEGALKNLRDGFPSDEKPYTDFYEYLSDSDLDEDEGSADLEEEEGYTTSDDSPSDDTTIDSPARETGGAVPDQGPVQVRGSSPLTIDKNDTEQATVTASDPGGCPGTTRIQLGKVAIIRDMAATT